MRSELFFPEMIKDVLSANVHQLNEITRCFDFSAEVRFYAKVLLSYLQRNVIEMEYLFKNQEKELVEIKSSTNFKILNILTQARIQIRNKNVEQKTIEELQQYAKLESLYRGELFFVIGLCYDSQNELHEARKSFNSASFYFENQGIFVKQFKCYTNAISCESRLYPFENFIPQYEFIIKKAIELNDHLVAGTNLNNISYEYEQIGALRAALQYSIEALNILDKYGYRSINYYFALVQRCNLYIKLDRLYEAQLDYEKSLACPFLELKEILNVLGTRLGYHENKNENTNALTIAWKLKMQKRINKYGKNKTTDQPLTEIEEKIVKLISTTPLTLNEIGIKLYGDLVDHSSIENRIKVFLSKIRKKREGLILISEGRYSLSSNLYPEYSGRAH